MHFRATLKANFVGDTFSAIWTRDRQGGSLLLPSSRPTQVGTTAGLTFWVLLPPERFRIWLLTRHELVSSPMIRALASDMAACGGRSSRSANAGIRRWPCRGLPLRPCGLPAGETRPAGPPAARRRGGGARRLGAAKGAGGRRRARPTRLGLARDHLGLDPRPRTVRCGPRSHRPGAGARLLPLRGGPGAGGGRRLLRRGLLRSLARDSQRRPVLARSRVLAGVPGTGRPERLAAYLCLAPGPRRVAPDRLLQPQDRPPTRTRRLRGTLPRVRRRPCGPARDRAGGGDLVRQPGLKRRRRIVFVQLRL